MQCVHVLLFSMICIVLNRSLFDVWCGILFSYLFHDSCLMWRITICEMYFLSCCYWDPFVIMLMGYSCCSHVSLNWDPFHSMIGGMLIIVLCELCHTNRSPFLNESSYSGTSLGSTPTWGHIPCMIDKTHACTSSLFPALNVAAYTILTLRPGDVVPPRQTPLSKSCVLCCWFLSCSFFFTAWIYVPLCYFKCNYNHITKANDLG